jgi:hypothetical protein
MVETLYCWRCKTDIPMLDDAEWQVVSPLFSNATQDIKRHCLVTAKA